MDKELSPEEVDAILSSLESSLAAMREAPGTPYEVRRQNLKRVDIVIAKLRGARQRQSPS